LLYENIFLLIYHFKFPTFSPNTNKNPKNVAKVLKNGSKVVDKRDFDFVSLCGFSDRVGFFPALGLD
jgi:hypothetical protein